MTIYYDELPKNLLNDDKFHRDNSANSGVKKEHNGKIYEHIGKIEVSISPLRRAIKATNLFIIGIGTICTLGRISAIPGLKHYTANAYQKVKEGKVFKDVFLLQAAESQPLLQKSYTESEIKEDSESSTLHVSELYRFIPDPDGVHTVEIIRVLKQVQEYQKVDDHTVKLLERIFIIMDKIDDFYSFPEILNLFKELSRRLTSPETDVATILFVSVCLRNMSPDLKNNLIDNASNCLLFNKLPIPIPSDKMLVDRPHCELIPFLRILSHHASRPSIQQLFLAALTDSDASMGRLGPDVLQKKNAAGQTIVEFALSQGSTIKFLESLIEEVPTALEDPKIKKHDLPLKSALFLVSNNVKFTRDETFFYLEKLTYSELRSEFWDWQYAVMAMLKPSCPNEILEWIYANAKTNQIAYELLAELNDKGIVQLSGDITGEMHNLTKAGSARWLKFLPASESIKFEADLKLHSEDAFNLGCYQNLSKDDAEVLLANMESPQVGSWLLSYVDGSTPTIYKIVSLDDVRMQVVQEFPQEKTIARIEATYGADRRLIPKKDKLVLWSLGIGNTALQSREYGYKDGVLGEIADLRTYDDDTHGGCKTEKDMEINIKKIQQLTPHSSLYIIGHCSPGGDALTSDPRSDLAMYHMLKEQLDPGQVVLYPEDLPKELASLRAEAIAKGIPITNVNYISVNEIALFFKTFAPHLVNWRWKMGMPRLEIRLIACYSGSNRRIQGEADEPSFAQRLSQALAEEGIPAKIYAPEEGIVRAVATDHYIRTNPRQFEKREPQPHSAFFTFNGACHIEHVLY